MNKVDNKQEQMDKGSRETEVLWKIKKINIGNTKQHNRKKKKKKKPMSMKGLSQTAHSWGTLWTWGYPIRNIKKWEAKRR